ncbi:unnamed protein product, partial [marine sediment metagenome]
PKGQKARKCKPEAKLPRISWFIIKIWGMFA